MFLATDTNGGSLVEVAWRAGRKPARGGTPNLLCIGEPFDTIAAELGAVADRVTVILPWGSLLKAVAVPEMNSLRQIARLCLPEAVIEIVFSYDEERDARERAPLGLAYLDEEHVLRNLPHIYREAGLQVQSAARMPQSQLMDYETAWAKRLAFGQPRDVWRIRATSGIQQE